MYAKVIQASFPASDERLANRLEAIEQACPMFYFLIRPQTVTGKVERIVKK